MLSLLFVTLKVFYDYQKLINAGEHFLKCAVKEDEETIIFSYDITGLISFTEVRKEEYVTILNLLMQIARFSKDSEKYCFSLEPANLYYNSNGTVRIQRRDLANGAEQEIFMEKYKALMGCALAGKYNYSDYLTGGDDLFGKESVTKPLLDLETLEELEDYLERLKADYKVQISKSKALVSRKTNIALKIAVIALFAAVVGLGIYSGLQYFKNVPYYKAINRADNAYIENDSVKLIDALSGIGVEDMDVHQKYILAKAYLQSENLTGEQKANIMEKLTLQSNEKELEYWIYLGRLDVGNAENLAMQLSDDELLLYAYMKDKSLTENDTTISGSEKEQAIKDLQSKIDELSSKYELEGDTANQGPNKQKGAATTEKNPKVQGETDNKSK